MAEFWDLYDANRVLLNRRHVRGNPISKGEYYLVVDIWTIDSQGKILIDKRHPNKKFGGLWECTGGSVIVGENSKIGALRELEEEIGIKAEIDELILIHSIRLEDRFVDTYVIKKNVELSDLVLQEEEVIEAKFVTISELDELCFNNMLIVKERYKMYRDKLAVYVKRNA